MKEGVATAIGFEPTSEVAPALNLVDRFVLNQSFEEERRRAPVDSLQHEEAAAEPRSKQMRQIGVDGRALGMIVERRQKSTPHVDEYCRTAGRHVEPPKQFLSWRLNGFLQAHQMRLRALVSIRVGRAQHLVGIR